MYGKYKDKAEFLIVYIMEAHAKDEWPVGKSVSFCDQPKVLEERCGLARKYKEEKGLSIEMGVDLMNNGFEKVFAAWPVRFYVVKEGKLVWKAQPNLEYYGYDPKDLSGWLKRNT